MSDLVARVTGQPRQLAYARWTDALARAGWRAEPVAAEQVPVGEALGRVTAAPV